MQPDDPIQRLVPSSIASRLAGRSGVVVLSLTDVLRGLPEEGRVLLVAGCDVPQVVAPILRAARELDAVVGLRAPGGESSPRERHAFFERVASAAEETGHRRAILLTAPPVVVSNAADPSLAAEQIYGLVDAGFTHVPIDASQLDPDEAPQAIVKAAEALVDLELGVDVRLSPGQEDSAGGIAAGMKLLGCAPALVGVSGGEGVGLAVVASEVDPVGVSWAEGADVADFRSGLRNAVGAGVRLVELASPFVREARVGMPDALGARFDELAASGTAASAARALEAELEALGGDELDRLEARVHAEALEVLKLLRLNGSNRRLHEVLVG